MKYNLVKNPAKSIILKYIQKNLKSFILAKLQEYDLELKSFISIIKKIVIVKVKTNIWLFITTENRN